MPLATEHTSPPADPDRRGLPGWTCFSKELLALEAGALSGGTGSSPAMSAASPGPAIT